MAQRWGREVGGSRAADAQPPKKNLRPVWNEYLELPVEDEKQIMTLTVEDHDLASGNDFMGKALVPLAPFTEANEGPVRAWYKLGDEQGDEPSPASTQGLERRSRAAGGAASAGSAGGPEASARVRRAGLYLR